MNAFTVEAKSPVGDVPVRVRAKFKVDGIKPNDDKNPDMGSTINLTPVYSGSAENAEFFKWTPGGNIVLSTVNPNAVKQFETGKEYYVDFTPAN